MEHLVRATRRELQKMGKSSMAAEFVEYASWWRCDAAPA
jgi:hypothetical protein